MRVFSVLCSVSIGLFGCGGDSDDSATATATTSSGLSDSTNPGAAVTEIKGAMSSVSALLLPLGLGGVTTNSYCTANGDPKKDGEIMAGNDADWASGLGFCQASFNTQSPDSAQGAMYIAGGVACSAGKSDMFKDLVVGTPKAASVVVSFSDECWGSDDESAAFRADSGMETLTLDMTSEVFADTAQYQYRVSFTLPGDSEESTLYFRSKDGVRAASFQGWAVHLDASTLSDATIRYESAGGSDDGGMTRIRILMKGSLTSAGAYDTLDSIQGFYAVGNGSSSSPTFSYLSTFSGNLEVGLLGGNYDATNGANDNSGAGVCYLPGSSSAACTGAEFIAGSVALGEALVESGPTASSAISAGTDALLEFTTIDLSDTNLFD